MIFDSVCKERTWWIRESSFNIAKVVRGYRGDGAEILCVCVSGGFGVLKTR